MNVSELSPYFSQYDRDTIALLLNHPQGATQCPSPTSEIPKNAWTTVTIDGKELRLLLTKLQGYDSMPLLPIDPRAEQVSTASQSPYLYAAENGKDKTLSELKKTQDIFQEAGIFYFAYTMNNIAMHMDYGPYQRISSRLFREEVLYIDSYQLIHLSEGDKALLYLSYVIP